nr:hypothetical protein [Ningiella sp. W23]
MIEETLSVGIYMPTKNRVELLKKRSVLYCRKHTLILSYLLLMMVRVMEHMNI